MRITGAVLRRFTVVTLCLAAVLLLVLYARHGILASAPEPPAAMNGVLDLRGWDFARDGVVELDGDWEFYWQQLLTPGDFDGGAGQNMTGFITPDAGTAVNEGGRTVKLGGQGYATYRLRIKISQQDSQLALKILDFATSYKLWERLAGRRQRPGGHVTARNGTAGLSAACELCK